MERLLGDQQDSHLPVFSNCPQANYGEATLTRCTLRKHARSPASLMAPGREGAVFVNGSANVTMDHCYVEVGNLMYGCLEAKHRSDTWYWSLCCVQLMADVGKSHQ
jgi:hypothetical protein